jgi:putative membrane protein
VYRIAAVLAATASLLLAACSTVAPAPEMAIVAVRPGASPLNLAEKAFVVKAINKTLYELEVSKIAAVRASDARVRAYAEGMVARQSQFTDGLVKLMAAKGVAPPKALPADKATKLHKLASLPPSVAFDQGYVRVIGIEDHQSNITLLEQGRRIAADRDLLAFIDRSLPTLRRQLSVAQELAGSISG